jgi:hypothetical protein
MAWSFYSVVQCEVCTAEYLLRLWSLNVNVILFSIFQNVLLGPLILESFKVFQIYSSSSHQDLLNQSISSWGLLNLLMRDLSDSDYYVDNSLKTLGLL